jgi:hypothetical protein
MKFIYMLIFLLLYSTNCFMYSKNEFLGNKHISNHLNDSKYKIDNGENLEPIGLNHRV